MLIVYCKAFFGKYNERQQSNAMKNSYRNHFKITLCILIFCGIFAAVLAALLDYNIALVLSFIAYFLSVIKYIGVKSGPNVTGFDALWVSLKRKNKEDDYGEISLNQAYITSIIATLFLLAGLLYALSEWLILTLVR